MNKSEKIIIDEIISKSYEDKSEIINKHRKMNQEIATATDFERLKLLEKKRRLPKLQEEKHDPLRHLDILKNLKANEENIEEQFKSLEYQLLKKIGNISAIEQKQQKKAEISPIYENIEQYYKDYIEHRKTFDKLSHSSIKGNNASFRYLKYFIQEDTVFTFKYFKELQKQFQNLPKNFFKYKKYYEKSYIDLFKLKEKEKYDLLDSKTINAHINNFRLFFDYLKYEEIIDQNHLNDIKPIPETTKDKREYSAEEIEKLLNNLDLEYKNMSKFALYTGFRIEEVLSIKKLDIEDSMIYLKLQDQGVKKHTRILPIHDNLKALINYQKRHNKGSFLFFNGNVSNEVKNVGKRVNRRLKDIIPDSSKSFHSFRKNFSIEIELNTTAEEKTKKYLMGHSQSKDITHMIYNRGKINIEKLKDCISQITFKF